MLFKDLEQLLSLGFPTRTLGVGQLVAERLLFRSHARHLIRNAVTRHLAKVTLPLATRTLFVIAQAHCMERTRTVVTADEFTPVIETDPTLV